MDRLLDLKPKRHVQRRSVLIGAAALVGTSASRGFAQAAWPARPVRVIVSFPPGGTSDVVARLLGQALTEKFGQQFIIDNRPGAAGTQACELLRKEAPDGHTLMLSNATPFTIAPTQFKKINFDPVADFTHVTYIGSSLSALFVQPSLATRELAAFIARAKAAPGKISYGSSGVGSITHLLGEAFKRLSGADLLHVPYKGTSPAIQDFSAGVLSSYFDALGLNLARIRSGEVVALGVAAPKRMSIAPDVPTFREGGVDLVLQNWLGLSGPAAMPPDVVRQIHAATSAMLATSAVGNKLDGLGIERTAMGPVDFTAFVGEQIGVWRPMIIGAGAQEK